MFDELQLTQIKLECLRIAQGYSTDTNHLIENAQKLFDFVYVETNDNDDEEE